MISSPYIIISLESPRRKPLERPTAQRLTLPGFELAISASWLLFLLLITTNSSTIKHFHTGSGFSMCMQNRGSVASAMSSPIFHQLLSPFVNSRRLTAQSLTIVHLRTGFFNHQCSHNYRRIAWFHS